MYVSYKHREEGRTPMYMYFDLADDIKKEKVLFVYDNNILYITKRNDTGCETAFY